MGAKFEIYQDKIGEFRFCLKAANGKNILASEGYKTRSGCISGIKSVKENASDSSRYVSFESKHGKYAFNLRAKNKQVIGVSQLYSSMASRNKGVASVKRNAAQAKVVDLKP